MAIIDDFADIASRMKGELAPRRKEPEPPEETLEDILKASLPQANWRLLNSPPQPLIPPGAVRCISCLGSGIHPRPRGGSCPDCWGRGYII